MPQMSINDWIVMDYLIIVLYHPRDPNIPTKTIIVIYYSQIVINRFIMIHENFKRYTGYFNVRKHSLVWFDS